MLSQAPAPVPTILSDSGLYRSSSFTSLSQLLYLKSDILRGSMLVTLRLSICTKSSRTRCEIFRGSESVTARDVVMTTSANGIGSAAGVVEERDCGRRVGSVLEALEKPFLGNSHPDLRW